uniref:Uncharacterized protein LOC114333112 n=1 Tax=Diabrotica virgifera virgifera TaxID=50390 RepID=A0A6P7FR53_DIAVI
MYYQNVGGLRTKLAELDLMLSCSSYDILVITESWLSEDILSEELGGASSYNVFRADRNMQVTSKTRGGGILVLVKSYIQASIIKKTESHIEQLFILCKYFGTSFVVGGVYIPPGSTEDQYSDHCLAVEEICATYPDTKFYIVGDFNLPSVQWSNSNNGVKVNCSSGSPALYLAQTYGFYNMFQMINTPNSRNVFLDLLFTNDNSMECCKSLDPLFCDSIHHTSYTFIFVDSWVWSNIHSKV